MRIGSTILMCLVVLGSNAQVAFGLFGGASEDRLWQTELSHVGVLGEFRDKRLPGAVLRISVSFCPERHEYRERYASVHDPEEYTWLAQVSEERLRYMHGAIDMKIPFEDNACIDGYYKGTYILAGLGYAQRWQTMDLWEQDQDGSITTGHIRKAISEPMLRAGFGGEWNFKWGGPFVEGLLTVSMPGLGPPGIRFPGAATLSIGYRYSFAKPEAGE